jgi:hypothetical protein
LWWCGSEKTGAGFLRPARGSWSGRWEQTQAFRGFEANQIAFVGVHGVGRFRALPRRSSWTWKPVPRHPRHEVAVAHAVPRPGLSDQERDYASILAIHDGLQHPAGSADCGKYRRRWLDYPPCCADSGHRNRLKDVPSRIVSEGALIARQTRLGAFTYSASSNAGQYRQVVVPV